MYTFLFYQVLLSLGIEPITLTLLVFYSWYIKLTISLKIVIQCCYFVKWYKSHMGSVTVHTGIQEWGDNKQGI